MAETLTYRFYPLVDLGGAYSEGAKIEVFYDDVAEDFKVYADDVLQVSGPIFNQPSRNVTDQSFNYQFCNGNDLYQAVKIGDKTNSYPYVKFNVTVNSPTCTGAVCDLVINSFDVVTDTGSGGSFKVNATSSAGGITYSIGGTFQSSDTFLDVPGGVTYTVTVKDANGCQDSTTVLVPLNIGYGTRYLCEFDNIETVTKIEIQQLNYTGDPVEVCLAEQFSINYNNQSFDSFYEFVLRPSNLTFSLISDINLKYIEMFTSSYKKWRAIVSRDNVEVWRGFIEPSTFSEPYVPTNYSTAFIFADGLKFLSRINATEIPLKGVNSAIKIVKEILDYAGLDIPIHVAIDVFSGGMNSSGETLAQTFVNFDTYKVREFNAYETLEEMLRPFGVVLLQQDGAWWIVRQERRGGPFDYFIYENGSQTGTGTYNGVKLWNCVNSNNIVSLDASLDIMPAFGKIKLTNEFDLKESLLKNYDFETPGFNTPFVGWTFVLNGSGVSFGSTKTPEGTSAEFRWSPLIDRNVLDSYIISSPAFIRYQQGDKIRFRYKIAYDRMSSAEPFLICKTRVVLDNTKYLNNEGEWVTSATDLRFYPGPAGGFTDLSFEADLPETTGITTSQIQVFIYPYWSDEAELKTDTSYTELKAVDTVDLPIGYKTSIAFTNEVGQTDNGIVDEYFELVGGTADVIPDDFDSNTNNKQWRKVRDSFKQAPTRLANNSFIVDNVEIDYLPQRFEPIEEQESTYILDTDNPEVLELSLKAGVLPWNFEENAEYSPNDTFNYRSQFFTNIIGLETAGFWGRKGLNESTRLQFLYINTVIDQHRTPTFRITGTFTNKSFSGGLPYSEIKPLDCLLNGYDNKYYIVTAYNAYDKDQYFYLELTELKAGNEVTEYGAFSDGFSDGFS